MDLGKAITWASINLNSVTVAPTGAPISGYKVDKIEVEPPPLTQYLEKRALRDGMVASDVYLGGRTIAAVVTAYGTSAGDFWDKAQALHRVMSAPLRRQADVDNSQEFADGFGFLSFFQPTDSTAVGQWPTSTYPNGIPLGYRVRPLDISYALERGRDASESDEGQSKAFNLRWFARDPRKIHTTELSATVSVAPSTLTTYRGDYPNAPIIQFTWTSLWSGNLGLTVAGVENIIDLSTISTGFPRTFYFDYGQGGLFDGDPLDAASTNYTHLVFTVAGFPTVRSGTVLNRSAVSPLTSCVLRVNEGFA